MKEVGVGSIRIGNGNPLVLIAGPCVIEDEKSALEIASRLKNITESATLKLVFKASYEKDNRSSIHGYRGPGLRKGLAVLRKVRDELGLPVLSDVHRESDIDEAKETLDIIQIPAFLCQQTSLLVAAGKSGVCVNVKKGQFMAPENMAGSIEKIESTGNTRILLTERGSSFGYNRLVSDMCSIPVMQSLGYPVVFDSTHIVRVYGIPSSDPKGGLPGFIATLTLAGVAAGCDALFIETHPRPEDALCDSASMLRLDLLPGLLEQAVAIHDIVRKNTVS